MGAVEKRGEVVQHLQMIQSVIARMNGNSFLLKRWSIILLVALILYFRANNEIFSPLVIMVIYVPFIALWGLDTFYLWQEKKYRNLHNEVAKRQETDFDMKGLDGEERYFCTLFSKTVWPLYIIEFALIGIIIFLEKQ